MPTIIALNPRPKAKKKKKKQKKRKMTALQLKYFGPKSQRKKKRKNKRKRPAMTALQKKYFGNKSQRKEAVTMPKSKKKAIKKRKNPPAKKRSYRRYARQTLGGVNMMGAVRSTVPLLFGALVAKFAAKKFAEGGAESDNWTWKNYLLALAGGFTAAFLTSATLKKRAAAQKVFEGSLLLIAYKLFTNEIAPQNPSLESWFGATDEFDPYSGMGYDTGDEGDLWAGDNEDHIKGIDGYWRPVSESHRLPAANRMGDVMVAPDPRYGDVMVSPDPRYGGMSSEINQMIENDGM